MPFASYLPDTNNIAKFEGDDFMFELNDEEVENLSRCKNFTLNMGRGSNIKYKPYVFTEQGVYMLMTVLRGELAEVGTDGEHGGGIEMANKIVREIIHAKGIDIGIYTKDFENEYISLTAIAKYRNDNDPRFVIQNWMRNRNTVEFLAVW